MNERFSVQPALTQIAATQGRRHSWLASQAGISVFRLSRAINGKGTLKRPEAESIASALQMPFSLLFKTTDVLKSDTETELAAS